MSENMEKRQGQVEPIVERQAQHVELILRHCANCGGEREHRVSLTFATDIRRDNVKKENEKHARKPYRVYECVYCGNAQPVRV